MSTTSSSGSQRILWFACLAILAASAIAADPRSLSLRPFEAVEPHMGTLFRIKLYAVDEQQAQRGFRAAFDRIEQLDAILSDYRPDSELNRLSVDAVRSPAKVSGDLFHVVAAAQELAEQTGGAFDITLGPVIRLWRQARKARALPAPQALEQARAHCGYRKLKVDFRNQTIEMDQAGMQLDVGGIAKGYTADEALKSLEKLGITSALVAASGDLAFSDAPPGKKGWKVGVDSFDRSDAPFTRVLELSHRAISTSGDTEQYLDIDGQRYSHIVDPRTGLGLTTRTTVTVIAQCGIDADGLATAVSVLGTTRGLAFVESRPGLAALILTRAGGHTQQIESRRFSRYTQKSSIGRNRMRD